MTFTTKILKTNQKGINATILKYSSKIILISFFTAMVSYHLSLELDTYFCNGNFKTFILKRPHLTSGFVPPSFLAWDVALAVSVSC